MTFTEETIKRIDDRKVELLKDMGRCTAANPGLGVNVTNVLFESVVCKNNWEVCRLDELTQMIEELTVLKQAITEVTGVLSW